MKWPPCLGRKPATDDATNADQAGSKKTQRAGLRNLRRRVDTGYGKASAGTAFLAAQGADVESEASDLTDVGIENREGQGCGELLTMAK